MLAGGLNQGNVAEAVRAAGRLGDRIIGVDVSSGVELDGVQNIAKVEAFIRAARSVR